MPSRSVHRNYRSFAALKLKARQRVTIVGWMVLAGAWSAGLMGVDTTLSLAYQSFAFLGCVVLLSLATLPWWRPRFAVRRQAPKFGVVGEKLSYTLQVRNLTPRWQRALTLWEELPDPRPTYEEFSSAREPGEDRRNWFDRHNAYYRWNWLITCRTRAQVREEELGSLPPGGAAEVRVELAPVRRGVLRLEGVTVTRRDPFGLFRALRRESAPHTILILPKQYRVPPFDLPGVMKYQRGGVSMASSVGESEEFVALRDYRPGDPLRHVHWRSFAKKGEPIVKEFQEEFFVRHALLLDTFHPQAYNALFEDAVALAASLAGAIETKDSLLDLMFVGPKAYCFTYGRGLAQTAQMLEVLAAVEVCRDQPFDTLEHLAVEHAAELSGCLCVLLAWDEPRQRLVRTLRGLGVPMKVFVVTEEEVRLAPGPLADHPENFHVLPHGKIQEKLALL